ncbi:MAG: hypothetical protein GQ467_06215, partial [Mariprofundaceae bacterium]|nr:hypothetical protein [Mariprofundaceae bacterium]
DARDGDGSTPLILAAEHGHIDALSRLLELGANPDLANDLGEVPIHRSARMNRQDDVLSVAGNIMTYRFVDAQKAKAKRRPRR